MSMSAWKSDGNAFLRSQLLFQKGTELARLERDLITESPGTFAMGTSNGRWTMARHLSLLNQALLRAIEDAQNGLLDGLVVCMPPQHGKSELISKHFPA